MRVQMSSSNEIDTTNKEIVMKRKNLVLSIAATALVLGVAAFAGGGVKWASRNA